MYDIENYNRARSVQHACELLTEYPQARLLAGGTDVLIQLHHLNPKYRHIVDVHDLPELKGIAIDRHLHLRIGSATTFTELIEHPLIQQHLPLLAEAAATIAGPQVRNVATYGGNICNGATSADSASPTLALKAELEIATAHGCYRRSIEGFHTGPGKVALQQGEIVVAFHFAPEYYQDIGSSYIKYAMRGDQLQHDCPVCAKNAHEPNAAFCSRCGNALFPKLGAMAAPADAQRDIST